MKSLTTLHGSLSLNCTSNFIGLLEMLTFVNGVLDPLKLKSSFVAWYPPTPAYSKGWEDVLNNVDFKSFSFLNIVKRI
jgi:hypothetical protein